MKIEQIFINSWALYGIALAEFGCFQIVVLNDLIHGHLRVVEIVNSMAEVAILFIKKTKPSEEIAAERTFFLVLIGLKLNHFNNVVFDLLFC